MFLMSTTLVVLWHALSVTESALSYQIINACLSFIFQHHSTHLVLAEGKLVQSAVSIARSRTIQNPLHCHSQSKFLWIWRIQVAVYIAFLSGLECVLTYHTVTFLFAKNFTFLLERHTSFTCFCYLVLLLSLLNFLFVCSVTSTAHVGSLTL